MTQPDNDMNEGFVNPTGSKKERLRAEMEHRMANPGRTERAGEAVSRAATIALPLVFLFVFLADGIRRLVTVLGDGRLVESFALADDAPMSEGALDVTVGSATVAVGDRFTLALSTADLATSTVAMLVTRDLVLLLGVTLVVVLALRPMKLALDGEFFTARVSTWVLALSWAAIGLWLGWLLLTIFGRNMVARDLGATEVLDSGALGSSVLVPLLVICLSALSDILRRAQLRGRKAEEELEGVV